MRLTPSRPTCLAGRAQAADLLLHTFGWAALVPVLGCFGWAWRALGTRQMHRLGLQSLFRYWRRCSSLAMAAVPPLPGWPIAAGSGGAIGAQAARIVGHGYRPPATGSALDDRSARVSVGIAALGWGMGVSIADWRLLLPEQSTQATSDWPPPRRVYASLWRTAP